MKHRKYTVTRDQVITTQLSPSHRIVRLLCIQGHIYCMNNAKMPKKTNIMSLIPLRKVLSSNWVNCFCFMQILVIAEVDQVRSGRSQMIFFKESDIVISWGGKNSKKEVTELTMHYGIENCLFSKSIASDYLSGLNE